MRIIEAMRSSCSGPRALVRELSSVRVAAWGANAGLAGYVNRRWCDCRQVILTRSPRDPDRPPTSPSRSPLRTSGCSSP